MHTMHLDLCQIRKVHSVKNNEKYAESCEIAASLSQKN